MDALKTIAADSLKNELPKFGIGDTVRVSVNIREGEKERIQMFEGTVIAKKGSGVSATFTVRRVSYGVGVERVFPVHSPNVKDVKVISMVRFAEASSTISVTELVRLLRLRSKSANSQYPIFKGRFPSLFCY